MNRVSMKGEGVHSPQEAAHTHRATVPPVLALMGRVVSLFAVAAFVTATPIILAVEVMK